MYCCAVKDPDAVLDYGFDWGKYWLPEGVTISDSSWVVSDESLTVETSAVSADNKQTMVILSGGSKGSVYKVTNKITLSDGIRKDDRTFELVIREK